MFRLKQWVMEKRKKNQRFEADLALLHAKHNKKSPVIERATTGVYLLFMAGLGYVYLHTTNALSDNEELYSAAMAPYDNGSVSRVVECEMDDAMAPLDVLSCIHEQTLKIDSFAAMDVALNLVYGIWQDAKKGSELFYTAGNQYLALYQQAVWHIFSFEDVQNAYALDNSSQRLANLPVTQLLNYDDDVANQHSPLNAYRLTWVIVQQRASKIDNEISLLAVE